MYHFKAYKWCTVYVQLVVHAYIPQLFSSILQKIWGTYPSGFTHLFISVRPKCGVKTIYLPHFHQYKSQMTRDKLQALCNLKIGSQCSYNHLSLTRSPASNTSSRNRRSLAISVIKRSRQTKLCHIVICKLIKIPS